MPKWNFHGPIDDDFEFDEDFDVKESYTGFEKIGKKKGEEDFGAPKKKASVKHQKRPDKEV
jgi:hypothetical protein